MIELQMRLGNSFMPFELRFREMEETKSILIFEDDTVTVRTIPLDHRVYTNGFLFKEKPGDLRLDIVACEELQVEKAYYRKIKQGANYTQENGEVIENSQLTSPGKPPKSYAFCSDTMYKEDIITHIKEVTALYHESTFLIPQEDLCKKTKHSTAAQAATIASKANVGMLILGHYSSRYKSYDMFTDEARPIFENSHCALDGKVFNI
jgi:ribonuclease Z